MAVNGYTRQSSAAIVTGGTIQASHFNNEYNAIETAFSATIGHNHDGTVGGGQTIGVAGLGLVPTAGAVLYSGTGAIALTTAGTASQLLQSNGTAAPTWTTATYPSTISANQLVLGTGANAVGTLATAANSVLITNASSVVTWTATLPATNMPALTGDVTSSAGATATTITAGAVTYAKLQTVAALSVIGNSGTSTATAAAISGTAADQVLRVASNGSSVGFGAVNLSGTGAVTGTLLAAQFPILTGDVTTAGGSLAATIASHAVTNSKFRQSSALSVVGNSGSATADVADIVGTSNQVLRIDANGTSAGFGAINLASTNAVTGTLPVSNGGIGVTSATANTVFAGPNSGSAAPSFRALTSTDGAAWVLIQTQTASNSASINFTSGLTSTYRKYKIVFDGVQPVTAGDHLYIRVSTDGGSTYHASATDYIYVTIGLDATNSSVNTNATGAAQIVICRSMDNSSAHQAVGELLFCNPSNNTIVKQFTGYSSWWFNASSITAANITGVYTSGTTINAFQFLCSSGNINAGTFTLYGIREN